MPEKDISERLYEILTVDLPNDETSIPAAAIIRRMMLERAEAAHEIDHLRFELQWAREERDAARAEVQCLKAELKETA